LKFHKEARVNPEKLMRLVQSTPGAQFTPAGVLRLPVDGVEDPAGFLERLHQQLAGLSA
jgi:transcription-repair coupling factor (superfamily II helicase)